MGRSLGEGRAAHETGDLGPAAGPGQPLGDRPQAQARSGRDQGHDLVRALGVMGGQRRGPGRDAAEPVLVRGQRLGAVVAVQAGQRGQVTLQRRDRGVRGQPDVRGDPGQQMIAGEQHVVVGVVEADVPRGVPGGPHHLDPAAGQVKPFAVAEQPVRVWQPQVAGRLGDPDGQLRGNLGRNAGPLQPDQVAGGPAVVRGAPGAAVRGGRGRHPGRQRGDLRLVHGDRRPGRLPEPCAQPVVVRVHVGDHDAGDRLRAGPGLLQPAGQVLPGALVVPARVDHDQRAVAVQQVAQRVAERAVRDRHRQRPHPGGHLLGGRQPAVPPGLALGQAGDGYLAASSTSAAWSGTYVCISRGARM